MSWFWGSSSKDSSDDKKKAENLVDNAKEYPVQHTQTPTPTNTVNTTPSPSPSHPPLPKLTELEIMKQRQEMAAQKQKEERDQMIDQLIKHKAMEQKVRQKSEKQALVANNMRKWGFLGGVTGAAIAFVLMRRQIEPLTTITYVTFASLGAGSAAHFGPRYYNLNGIPMWPWEMFQKNFMNAR